MIFEHILTLHDGDLVRAAQPSSLHAVNTQKIMMVKKIPFAEFINASLMIQYSSKNSSKLRYSHSLSLLCTSICLIDSCGKCIHKTRQENDIIPEKDTVKGRVRHTKAEQVEF